MTFNPAMRKIVERTAPKIGGGKVCEFGNQRFTAGSDFSSTQAFYESLGFQYLALDANQEMGARIWDLNETGARSQFGEFDLVTNNGTAEHVFDQSAVFINAHELCKQGGYMVHLLPMGPWVNHGFFNYNPIFFRDLARANDYHVEEARICTRDGNEVLLDPEWAYQEKRPKKLMFHLISLARDTFCAFVFRKDSPQEFRKPYQGKYLQTIEDQKMRQSYA